MSSEKSQLLTMDCGAGVDTFEQARAHVMRCGMCADLANERRRESSPPPSRDAND